MEVEYYITPEDASAFWRYHQENSPALRRSRFQTSIVVALMSGALILILRRSSEPGVIVEALIFATIGFLFVRFMAPAISQPLNTLSMRRAMAEGKNRAVFGKRRLILQPEGMTTISDVEASQLKWIGVERIAVADRYAYFYTSANAAIPVPRSAFRDDQEFNQFVETARRYHLAASDTTGAPY